MKAQIRQFGADLSTADLNTLSQSRQDLQVKIDSFNTEAETYLRLCQADELNYLNVDYDSQHGNEDSIFDDDEDMIDEETGIIGPESASLCLPSSLGIEECERIGWGELAKYEIELRNGEANDALEKIRLALGHKALLFYKKKREEKSQKQSTRSWKAVRSTDIQITKHVTNYRRARQAIIQLGGDVGSLKEISKQDLNINKDVTESNRHSQRSDTLSWIWRTSQRMADTSNGDWMQECE